MTCTVIACAFTTRLCIPSHDTLEYTLQPLQALTCLANLWLHPEQPVTINNSMLTRAQHLTQVQLSWRVKLEPSTLSALSNLQHLHMGEASCSDAPYGAAGVAELLLQLQHLQQLTHLDLQRGMHVPEAERQMPAMGHVGSCAAATQSASNWLVCLSNLAHADTNTDAKAEPDPTLVAGMCCPSAAG